MLVVGVYTRSALAFFDTATDTNRQSWSVPLLFDICVRDVVLLGGSTYWGCDYDVRRAGWCMCVRVHACNVMMGGRACYFFRAATSAGISLRESIGPCHKGSSARRCGKISGVLPCHGVSSHSWDP